MKKGLFLGYGLVVAVSLMMQSCQDDPILPNGGGNDIDTTWVSDSTNNDPNGGGGSPMDSTNTGGGTQIDSTGFNGGGSGGNWIPNDSTGGNGNPNDTLGGN
jgi:hypothetical protein